MAKVSAIQRNLKRIKLSKKFDKKRKKLKAIVKNKTNRNKKKGTDRKGKEMKEKKRTEQTRKETKRK